MVTNEESKIATHTGGIQSSTAALPTEAGVVWQWWDDEAKSWQDDANMRCIEGEPP